MLYRPAMKHLYFDLLVYALSSILERVVTMMVSVQSKEEAVDLNTHSRV
jgi:hypothetical protein